MQIIFIIIFFLLWRNFDFLIVFFSQKVIPYLGFFPYKDQLPKFNLPRWISTLANFDGLHYILIAKNGYSEFEQAFFPLYPLLMRFLSPLFTNNQLLTGLIISNVSFLIGLILFYKYLRLIRATKMVAPTTDSGDQNGRPYLTDSTNYIRFYPILSVLFLLVFPTSFFFGAVYTEGLFFLLLISTLYYLKKEKYLLVIIFAFLASLTRLVGVFLVIPIIFHFIEKYQILKIYNKNRATKIVAPTLLAPVFGLGIYCFYLWRTTGDPFFFLTSQPIFGANRSSHLILLPQVYWRYLKIFFTAAHDSRFYVSVIEFSLFSFVLIILILDLLKNLVPPKAKRNYDLIALNFFSFANLILPTLTGTFSSIPRYALLSLSFFIYLGQIKNVFVKYLILIIFVVLHILLLGYFTQGYFVS